MSRFSFCVSEFRQAGPKQHVNNALVITAFAAVVLLRDWHDWIGFHRWVADNRLDERPNEPNRMLLVGVDDSSETTK
jgi:CHASE2 domain-containing sensor protein